jgi:hypothetical protein
VAEDWSVTNRITDQSDHADVWVAKCKNGFWNFLSGMMKAEEMSNKLLESPKHTVSKVRAFRLQLMPGTKHTAENSTCDIDGEPYIADIIQGMVLEERIPIIG